eukprot:gene12312-12448_t
MNIIHVSAMLGRLGKLLRQASQQLPEQELACLELFMQQVEAKSLELMSVVLAAGGRPTGPTAPHSFIITGHRMYQLLQVVNLHGSEQQLATGYMQQ